LQDLQVYDEASRGPWGAMVLLKTSKFSLASLGALIVLFLLAFDPFIQQLITTPQKTLLTSENSTAIPRATSFNQSGMFGVHDWISRFFLMLSQHYSEPSTTPILVPPQPPTHVLLAKTHPAASN
jgi:hypothetical protein